MESLIMLLVYVIVLAIIVGIAIYLINYAGLPNPLRIGIIAILLLIVLLIILKNQGMF